MSLKNKIEIKKKIKIKLVRKFLNKMKNLKQKKNSKRACLSSPVTSLQSEGTGTFLRCSSVLPRSVLEGREAVGRQETSCWLMAF
jgi:hypothetical protein